MMNEGFNETFRRRTFAFSKGIIHFLKSVPYNSATHVMANQLAKSATSVGANFRAFCRARSTNESYSKICIVVEEADESVYWLELFRDTSFGDQEQLPQLIQEATELLKVTVKIKRNLSRN